VYIVIFYARITTIDQQYITNMQTGLDNYIWLSNAPQSTAAASQGRRVQIRIKATATYAPVGNGGLPMRKSSLGRQEMDFPTDLD
jgi:hypothetical protein